MYAKINNGAVETYPYSIGTLRKDNPAVSFPRSLTDELLSSYGIKRVNPVPVPNHDVKTQNAVVNETPHTENGEWFLGWTIVAKTAEEVAATNAVEAQRIRNQRDMLLSKTDWRFRTDMNPSQAWVDYCQALRDVPSQTDFPWNVQWPTQPE